MQAALGGETRVAFVSGDAGSGKTTLLETFAVAAMTAHPELLVAGARRSPGGGGDPFAPLRRVLGMLCGDSASDVTWRLARGDLIDRLQQATERSPAALGEYGPGLVDTLVPAASLARRASLAGHGAAAEQGSWRQTVHTPPVAPGATAGKRCLTSCSAHWEQLHGSSPC